MPDAFGFFREMRRRHVWRAAIAYAIAGWLIVQVTTQVFPVFHMPDWTEQIVVILVVIGFPIVVALAWVYEIRPGGGGVWRTAPEGSAEARPAGEHHQMGRKLNALIMAVLALAVVVLLGNQFIWHKGVHGTPGTATPAKPAVTSVVPAATSAAGANKAPGTAVTAAAPAAIAITAQPTPAKSVAVLPFENLSADKNNAYFADGMQDLILTKLADIGDLKVISRTSTMKYASHPDDLKTIGRQLGVATILEGSVQKAGNQVLINVQLINAQTDAHIWAESYRRTFSDVFGVEGEVADKVAKALNAKLTAAQSARISAIPTRNAAAYDAYLQGEYYRYRSVETAAGYYRKAVDADPGFALAWARLSAAQSARAAYPYVKMDYKQALAAAKPAKVALDHALALAPHSPDTLLAKGLYLQVVTQDAKGARLAFEAVLAVQPNNATALDAVGGRYAAQGQWSEALEYSEKAAALAPRDPGSLNALEEAYMALRRYPQAVRTARRLLALDPTLVQSTLQLAGAYTMQGDLADAKAVFDSAPATVRNTLPITVARLHLSWLRRDFATAHQLLDALKSYPKVTDRVLEVWRGKTELYAGHAAQARQHLDRAIALYDTSTARDFVSPLEYHMTLSGLYALQGRAPDASREKRLYEQAAAEHGSHKVFNGKLQRLSVDAENEAALGHAGAAVKALDAMLAIPAGYYISVQQVKLDPTWDPIRKDPRFQALLKKYGASEPAAATSGAAHD